MKSVFILTCVNAPNNIEYTITYLPLFPAHNLAPERDRSCPMSPSYWPVSSVMQLCLYRLLAVTSAVFSHADCTGFAPPARVDWLGYLLVVVMPVGIVLLNVVPAGCVQVSHCQPLPSHWFCSFGLNYPRNLFGLNMIAWRLPWGDCGWTWDQPGRAVKKNQKPKIKTDVKVLIMQYYEI